MFDHGATDAILPRLDTESALAQSTEFANALRLAGQAPLMLKSEQNLLVLRRSFWRFPVAMINRAEMPAPAQLFQALHEAGLRRTPIILSPNHRVPELAKLGAVPLMSPASIALLRLQKDATARRAMLAQKWRNRLHHGEAQSLRVTRQNLPLSAGHWLLRADAAQQEARGYQAWPVALTLAYAQANRGCAKLFEARDGNDIVAGVLLLTHGDGATYHVAHTTDRGKALSAHNLLMWRAMEWLAAKGIRQLDLGVINTEDAPGLARFKLGTGAEVKRLGGTWLYWPPLGRSLAPLAALDRTLMSA
ncbi:GNAT family N-acetyltransferase [Phaeobacter sp. HF9A]|uniref:GNAT family N-acetyltransferase n=1 Tax=Phaeobacter sp. HF9A TaxID=2721561 RepID=UPI00142F8836|nr:GNAT family N-acetyltransferase [Phaeobacter sp. HF9A]NIZ15611.1 GNAT family N-acetyltransferase [Phaeobacter sp. HF9A]